MRENDKEEEFNSSSKNFMKTLSRIDTNRSEKYIELEDRNPRKTRLPSSIKRDSQTSFDRALLNEEKKEDNNLENDNNNLDNSDNEEEYTKDYLNNFDSVLNTFKNLNIVSAGINNINDMKKNSYYNDLLSDFNKFYSKCEELKKETVSNMEKYMKDNINNTCSICYQKFEKIDDMIVTKC